MAEQAQNPDERDAAASDRPDVTPPSAAVVDDHIETVRVRRAPKFSVFLVVGAAVGILVALILTFAFNGTSDESTNTGMVYSSGQVFGFLTLICVTGGVVLGATVALIFDRVLARRSREVVVDRERIHTQD